jgi:hypothetical protein
VAIVGSKVCSHAVALLALISATHPTPIIPVSAQAADSAIAHTSHRHDSVEAKSVKGASARESGTAMGGSQTSADFRL